MIKLISRFIAVVRAMLDRALSSLFNLLMLLNLVVGISKKQSYISNRIAKETVYSIWISFLTNNVRSPVDKQFKRKQDFVLDTWYDDNKALEIMFKKGYVPVVCPNKNRWRGHYRKRARKSIINIPQISTDKEQEKVALGV